MKKETHNSPAIELKKLSKISDSGDVLFADVTGSIRQGSLTIVKGPSGCGKTTLLRIIAGLEKPTHGSAELHGRLASDATSVHMPPFERNIGMLFQDLALWPHMRGIEQLQFVWNARHGNTPAFDDELKSWICFIDFPRNLLSRYPHELSRGQQQRLAIIRSIITKPPILLFDEPFTGLDAHLRSSFVACIHHIRKSTNPTILIVTHDMFELPITPDGYLVFADDTITFR